MPIPNPSLSRQRNKTRNPGNNSPVRGSATTTTKPRQASPPSRAPFNQHTRNTTMKIEVQGTITSIGEAETRGSGDFTIRKCVVEWVGDNPQYPQKYECEFMKERTAQLDGFAVGQLVNVKADLRGRAWTSPDGTVKHFLSLAAWRIDPVQQQLPPQHQQYAQPAPVYAPPAPPAPPQQYAPAPQPPQAAPPVQSAQGATFAQPPPPPVAQYPFPQAPPVPQLTPSPSPGQPMPPTPGQPQAAPPVQQYPPQPLAAPPAGNADDLPF